MRALPSDFDTGVVAAIDARLDAIVADGIAVPLAIESGSRAWGFASPDSDYDCRFLFLRPRDAYLSLWPQRDVIETPLDGVLDVGGWDLGKALKLIVKGNAVVVEWLRSPIVYRGDPTFVGALAAFADAHAPRDAVRRHYLHLAQAQRAEWQDARAIKKLFYVLRPAAALRWMADHPAALPPMHFPTLLDQCSPTPAVRDAVAALIEAKGRTRELGTATMPPAIEAFVDAAIADTPADTSDRDLTDAMQSADRLFRELVDRHAQDAP